MVDAIAPERLETLGPAERIVQMLTTFTDHVVHNRPGMVSPDGHTNTGVRWQPISWKEEGEDGAKRKVVYRSTKFGKKVTKTAIGFLGEDGETVTNDAGAVLGEYRKPGIFPEVATFLYGQIAEIWKLDNEFAARWASWAFPREHRDMKVILAAFLLVQNRSGEPIVDTDTGKVLFHDDDYRDVAEAMCLTRATHDLNPKLMLRIGDVLALDDIAAINRDLGFGKSARNPTMGRYPKVVRKWLRYREDNPRMLAGLVKAGFKTTVQKLARRVGYKPRTDVFFKTLRWKQKQAKDGRRDMAIGVEVDAAESWAGMTEQEVCEVIVKTKPNYKRLVGLLPSEVGLTRAVMAAAVEAGSLSNADLIILTPTLEELGLLKVADIKARWQKAIDKAENQRAANILKNVKTQEARDGLQEAADTATKKALEEVTKDLRVYVCVDKSGSMQGAISGAKVILTKFLQGFSQDRLHVSVFNSGGREIDIQHASKAGVEQAFRGHTAGGGTCYSEGVRSLAHHKPLPGEDVLFLFVGDEHGEPGRALAGYVQQSGLNPNAFALIEVNRGGYQGNTVKTAAVALGIPCFKVDEDLFDDPYAVTRALQNLIASTPVGQVAAGQPVRRRKTLVEQILETPLLQKPVWASAA